MEENTSPPNPPPPPVVTPPLITPPPAARAPRRGRGWMILAFVLLALLVVSVVYNIASFASGLLRGGGAHYYSARVAGPRLEEVVKEDNDAANKIAVIEVNGIISGDALDQSGFNMVDVIRAQLKRAEEDDRVKAVILKVDSPGGEVLASDEIYNAISKFQDTARKPVVASMGSLAASGGYYISSPCRWIVANELTITGSIGVIMHALNYRGLMDKVGLVPQTYKSGKYKDMLSGSREPDSVSPEERAMLQSLIDETFARFKTVVQKGRDKANEENNNLPDKGHPLSPDWQDYADGRVLSGIQAAKLGFVDELGGFDKAVERTKKLARISRANLIEYQQHFDFSDLFRLFGKSDAKNIKLDLGVDVPKLRAGQLYFLSPTFLH